MPPLQISLDEAQEKGVKKGWHKGHKEGLQEGMQQGRQEVALNFLSAGLDLETVSKCTGLSVDEINKLKAGSC